MQMMLVLTIFESFLKFKAWGCIRHCRLQHEPLLHLNALALEILVETNNEFSLYIIAI